MRCIIFISKGSLRKQNISTMFANKKRAFQLQLLIPHMLLQEIEFGTMILYAHCLFNVQQLCLGPNHVLNLQNKQDHITVHPPVRWKPLFSLIRQGVCIKRASDSFVRAHTWWWVKWTGRSESGQIQQGQNIHMCSCVKTNMDASRQLALFINGAICTEKNRRVELQSTSFWMEI